ncbi:hypothetical protein ACFX14_023095 [Malus domestica]
MSSSNHKNDDDVPPLYCQGGSLSKVGYFKDAHFKICSDDLFRDFLKAYWHTIRSGVRVKRVKDGSSRDHDWAKETLEVSEEWESDSSPELHVPMNFIFDSKFGSTLKTSLDMKKVHVALGIPSEYREWHWLLSLFRREKCGLPPRK